MNNIQRNNFIVLALAIIISLILKISHILLPFMFGPIIAAVICVKAFKLESNGLLVKSNWFNISWRTNWFYFYENSDR